METKPSISFYLDTRRAKESGLFPVKLRVYYPPIGRTKFYPTDFDFSEKEFKSIWETTKPRSEHKVTRLEMSSLESKANEAADLMPFTFAKFERRLFRHSGEGTSLVYHYEQVITRLKANNQLGTASNYNLSLRSILNFEIYRSGKNPAKLSFAHITPAWLAEYELYMLEEKQLSRTTISMYLRALRTLFNSAISENEIERELYPFGNKKYQIPSARNVKKALNPTELKALLEAKPSTKEQAKARDFWFFSFICNGINVKDIALLKFSDLQGESIVFYRAKTLNTSKQNIKPITIYLTDFAKSIIAKYGNKDTDPKNFIFPILAEEMTKETQFKNIKNFTRFINQNLKKLASTLEITESISTYWARHSFATHAIRMGATMEFVGEALDHKNPKTTLGYFAGFEEKSKRDLTNSLMNF